MSYEAAQQHARQKAEEAQQRIAEKRATLEQLCSRLPAQHQLWSAKEVAAFKTAAQRGLTVARKANATERLLDDTIHIVRQFYI